MVDKVLYKVWNGCYGIAKQLLGILDGGKVTGGLSGGMVVAMVLP